MSAEDEDAALAELDQMIADADADKGPFTYDVHAVFGFIDPSPLSVRKIYIVCPQI